MSYLIEINFLEDFLRNENEDTGYYISLRLIEMFQGILSPHIFDVQQIYIYSLSYWKKVL
jgi:hypothetical protein